MLSDRLEVQQHVRAEARRSLLTDSSLSTSPPHEDLWPRPHVASTATPEPAAQRPPAHGRLLSFGSSGALRGQGLPCVKRPLCFFLYLSAWPHPPVPSRSCGLDDWAAVCHSLLHSLLPRGWASATSPSCLCSWCSGFVLGLCGGASSAPCLWNLPRGRC